MNPFFWLLVILAAVIVWFLLAFAYKPVGVVTHKIIKDATDQLCDNENEKEINKNERK